MLLFVTHDFVTGQSDMLVDMHAQKTHIKLQVDTLCDALSFEHNTFHSPAILLLSLLKTANKSKINAEYTLQNFHSLNTQKKPFSPPKYI